MGLIVLSVVMDLIELRIGLRNLLLFRVGMRLLVFTVWSGFVTVQSSEWV